MSSSANGHVVSGGSRGAVLTRALCRSAKLVHVPGLSRRPNPNGNLIVHGENLAVLKALRSQHQSVKCCYIDPPYNNRERHYHYQDNRSHGEWLEEVTARVEAIAPFLRADGSLWISIDDREVHYLKVACDRIFGRSNFVTTVIWEQRTTRENRKVFSNNHEYILVYAKDYRQFVGTRNPLSLSDEVRARYKNPDNDPRGPWQSVSANAQAGHGTPDQFYSITGPGGKVHVPPHGRCWVYSYKKMKEEIAANNIWFGRNGNGVPRIKRFLTKGGTGLTPETLWRADAVGTNDYAKKHLLKMFPVDEVFDTPKPESLIHRILEIATSPGDLVLDAYLGSGTTAAVAHKSDRRYIGIEEGDHAIDLSARRLAMVVAGDNSGAPELANWKGGGGFDFVRLE